MSTYYRTLKEPWGSIRSETRGIHTTITLWDRKLANCGDLVVQDEDESAALRAFFVERDRYQVLSSQEGPVLVHLIDSEIWEGPLLDCYGRLSKYRDHLDRCWPRVCKLSPAQKYCIDPVPYTKFEGSELLLLHQTLLIGKQYPEYDDWTPPNS